MAIILVGGEKGGTGKSTVATNIVTMREQEVGDSFLFDIDDQKTSTLWASRRDENNIKPRIASSQKILDQRIQNAGLVIRNAIKDLAKKYGDIIIDAGGAANEVLRAAMTLADVAILPLAPSSFDTWTLDNLNNIVTEARETNPKLIAKIVWNKVATHPQTAKAEIEESDEILNDFESLARFNTTIVHRVAVRRSQTEGLSIIEYNKDDKANQEIQSLYKEVFHGQ